jgi:hypothetical protein
MNRNHLITASLFLLTMASGVSAETVSVITRENTVREDCRFLAPAKARVQYGDQLEVTAREGDWFRVKFRNAKGCIHKNAVTESTVPLKDVSGKGYGASSDEVALAGKGFNPEVEKAYRGKHPELDFNAVDSIEGYKVAEESLKAFISAGGLNQP